MTLELTSRCTLACTMCPRSWLPRGPGGFREGDMEPALFRRLVDELATFPERALVPFFRGEPLLHPQAADLLAYAHSRGVGPIQLATNATVLTAELAQRLLDIGLDFVSFSLDATDSAAYERIRRGARHEAVAANVEGFLALRARFAGPRPLVQVSAVATAGEETRVGDFVRAWRGRVDRVRIYPEHSPGGRFGRLATGRPPGPRRPCLKTVTDLVVSWDGVVGICNHDWAFGAGLGPLGGRTLREVWEGAGYRAIREAHLAGRIPEALPCAGCDHWAAGGAEGGRIGELYD